MPKNLELAEKLLKLSPSELLLKIKQWKHDHPDMPETLEVLTLAYKIKTEELLEKALR